MDVKWNLITKIREENIVYSLKCTAVHTGASCVASVHLICLPLWIISLFQGLLLTSFLLCGADILCLNLYMYFVRSECLIELNDQSLNLSTTCMHIENFMIFLNFKSIYTFSVKITQEKKHRKKCFGFSVYHMNEDSLLQLKFHVSSHRRSLHRSSWRKRNSSLNIPTFQREVWHNLYYRSVWINQWVHARHLSYSPVLDFDWNETYLPLFFP